jgi:hypothetical protein
MGAGNTEVAVNERLGRTGALSTGRFKGGAKGERLVTSSPTIINIAPFCGRTRTETGQNGRPSDDIE